MIAIVDYGVGNLFSLKSSFAAIGREAVITGDAETILRADHVLLPGVGAFEDAANKLRSGGLDRLLKDVAESGGKRIVRAYRSTPHGGAMRPPIPFAAKAP